MSPPIPNSFGDALDTLENHGRTLWLGQSVDTSVIHASYPDYIRAPVLTSVGCVMRRPEANGCKFDSLLRQRIGAGSRLMVDSGGFVLMTKAVESWDVHRVAAIYERIESDHLVSLDVPPSLQDGLGDRRRKYDQTIDNLSRLTDRFGSRIVPVAHGTNIEELDLNCRRIAALTASPPIVGLGGLVPTLQRCGSVTSARLNTPHRRIADAVACVRVHFPHSSLHLFGVGSPHTVLGAFAFGVDSVDSIGWRQAAGFGSVFIPGRHRRLLTHRERTHPCRPFAAEEDLELLAACLCPECRSASDRDILIDRLASHFRPRAVHNIWVLYNEIAAYLRAKRQLLDKEFLESRLSDAWLDAISLQQSKNYCRNDGAAHGGIGRSRLGGAL